MVNVESDAPAESALSVSPNPFNVSTTIEFVLTEHGHAALELFNSSGQKVRTLVNAELPAGKHTAVWDGRDDDGLTISSGLYFSRLVTERYSGTAKMLLMK